MNLFLGTLVFPLAIVALAPITHCEDKLAELRSAIAFAAFFWLMEVFLFAALCGLIYIWGGFNVVC